MYIVYKKRNEEVSERDDRQKKRIRPQMLLIFFERKNNLHSLRSINLNNFSFEIIICVLMNIIPVQTF